MSKQIITILIVSVIILVIIYLLNNIVLRENFESKSQDMLGNFRKMQRYGRKRKEEFIGNIIYKIKSGLRRAKL